jgi:polar amino acid transport system substrate-binding protein
VRLRKVGVTTENRFQRLEQGDVDLLIATIGDTRERRALATAIEPNYYGGGVGVLFRPGEAVRDWAELRGKSLCALQSAYFNKPITQRYILTLQLYRSVRDAQLALRDGRCAGYLYTDTALQHMLAQPQWAGYAAPLEPAFVTPWAMSIARAERGTELERLLGDLVASWHREGVLIELERRWGVRPSAFVRDAAELWRRQDADGQLLCRRGADGQWPVACRNRAFVTSADVQGLRGAGLWLKDTLGLDLSLLHDAYDRERYLRGMGVTLLLVACATVLTLLLGYAGARAALAGSRLPGALARLVAAWARMTPPILLMYLLFFGLGSALHAASGIALSPFAVAVFCLSVYHGAIVVSALLEAAQMVRARDPHFQLRLATLPALLAPAAVGIRSALSNLTKSTAIASAIAVPELLSATTAVIADQGNPGEMMVLLMLVFYGLSSVWLWTLLRLERRLLAWAKDGAMSARSASAQAAHGARGPR